MSGFATAALAGNITRDPETKTFESGNSITEFGVAVNTRRKQGEEWTEVVSFFSVSVWGAFGELVARKLKKGDLVSVAGTLEENTWETDDGQKRSKIRVIAREVSSEGMFRTDEEAAVAGAGNEAVPVPQPVAAGAGDDEIPF